MDAYTFALALGGAGLAAMAITGAAHMAGHTSGHADATHDGHGAPHAPSDNAAPHGAAAPAHEHVAGDRHDAAGGGARAVLLSLVSPRVLFSALVGFGLAGSLARPLVGGGPALALIAVIGAVIFEGGIVRPLWNFMFRFASRPALTLESALLGEARAATTFNRNGEGIVALEVDGQVVQCLGTLRADDRALGVQVRAGDVLRVEDVDSARQRCTVSYVGRAVASG